MSDQPHLITDAAPSLDEEQARRRRTYAILMVVHIVGFALSYPLYLWQPWAGVAAVVLTGVLPWVAVLLANGPPRRAVRKPPPTPTIQALSTRTDGGAPSVVDAHGSAADHAP